MIIQPFFYPPVTINLGVNDMISINILKMLSIQLSILLFIAIWREALIHIMNFNLVNRIFNLTSVITAALFETPATPVAVPVIGNVTEGFDQ